MKTDWKKGDTCYIAMGGSKLSKGKILEVLDLSEHGYTYLNYLIEIPTHIEEILEVRQAYTMAEFEDGPLGIFMSLRKGD